MTDLPAGHRLVLLLMMLLGSSRPAAAAQDNPGDGADAPRARERPCRSLCAGGRKQPKGGFECRSQSPIPFRPALTFPP